VVGFPGMPNYPDNKDSYQKIECRIDRRVSFSEMFLPHEHGSLLTKVVMFEIIFSSTKNCSAKVQYCLKHLAFCSNSRIGRTPVSA